MFFTQYFFERAYSETEGDYTFKQKDRLVTIQTQGSMKDDALVTIITATNPTGYNWKEIRRVEVPLNRVDFKRIVEYVIQKDRIGTNYFRYLDSVAHLSSRRQAVLA